MTELLDHSHVSSTIGPWLEDRLEGSGAIEIGSLKKPGAGLSAGTVFMEARRSNEPELTHHLVLRTPPPDGEGVFPKSDLGLEVRFQTELGASGIPVAPLIGIENESGVFGRPFVVTRRVEGRLVDSNDPYMSSGWLHDESPEYQRHLAEGFFCVLADLHRIPVSDAPQVDRSTLSETVDRWTRYLSWADTGAAPQSLYDSLEWCQRNMPETRSQPSLLWGDAQLANAVFGYDGTVAALLDFELAGAGPAELDLGWFLCLHDMTVARCGEDLPGFRDRSTLLETYQLRLGRRVEELDWYETFAAVSTAMILVRMASIFSRGGTDLSWLARNNPALDYLANRLG